MNIWLFSLTYCVSVVCWALYYKQFLNNYPLLKYLPVALAITTALYLYNSNYKQEPKAGRWERGIWLPAAKRGAKVEIEPKVTLENVQEAYRELWKAKRNLLSKAQVYSHLHKKFLGLDKIAEEMEAVKDGNIKPKTIN